MNNHQILNIKQLSERWQVGYHIALKIVKQDDFPKPVRRNLWLVSRVERWEKRDDRVNQEYADREASRILNLARR